MEKSKYHCRAKLSHFSHYIKSNVCPLSITTARTQWFRYDSKREKCELEIGDIMSGVLVCSEEGKCFFD